VDILFTFLFVFAIPVLLIAGVVWLIWKLLIAISSAPDWQRPLLVLFDLSESNAENSKEDLALMKRLAAKAVKAAKTGDIDAEQSLTLQAFNSFCELKAEEIIQSALDHNNSAGDENLRELQSKSDYENTARDSDLGKGGTKVPTASEASHRAHVIGANCIAEMRENGALCIGSTVLSSLAASTVDEFLVLRSDRLISGNRAYRVSRKTKVLVVESGDTQVVQKGSTSKTTSRGQVTYGTNSDTFFGESITNTDISYRQVDNRSLQLLITDRGWQINKTFFGPQVQNARAFAEALDSLIDDL
jgi:hypothetical protein